MKMKALKVLGWLPYVFLNEIILLALVQNQLRGSVQVDRSMFKRVDGEIRLGMRLGVVFPLVGEFFWFYRSSSRDACTVKE